MTDCLDMRALRRRQPTFAKLPKLRQANYNLLSLRCSTTGPGQIPPPSSVSGRRKS
jgi:hypothetical protein